MRKNWVSIKDLAVIGLALVAVSRCRSQTTRASTTDALIVGTPPTDDPHASASLAPEPQDQHAPPYLIRWTLALSLLGVLGLGVLRVALSAFYGTWGVRLDETGWSSWDLALRSALIIASLTPVVGVVLAVFVIPFASEWMPRFDERRERIASWIARSLLVLIVLGYLAASRWIVDFDEGCNPGLLSSFTTVSVVMGALMWVVALSVARAPGPASGWRGETLGYFRTGVFVSRGAAVLVVPFVFLGLIGILTEGPWEANDPQPWEDVCSSTAFAASACAYFGPVTTSVSVKPLTPDGSLGAIPLDDDGFAPAVLLGRPTETAVLLVPRNDEWVVLRVNSQNILIVNAVRESESSEDAGLCAVD